MVQATDTQELKAQIKRLNSKAGQIKMDLHDLAEGLPIDYERLIEAATETYAIFHQITAFFTLVRYRGCGGYAPTQGLCPCTLFFVLH